MCWVVVVTSERPCTQQKVPAKQQLALSSNSHMHTHTHVRPSPPQIREFPLSDTFTEFGANICSPMSFNLWAPRKNQFSYRILQSLFCSVLFCAVLLLFRGMPPLCLSPSFPMNRPSGNRHLDWRQPTLPGGWGCLMLLTRKDFWAFFPAPGLTF